MTTTPIRTHRHRLRRWCTCRTVLVHCRRRQAPVPFVVPVPIRRLARLKVAELRQRFLPRKSLHKIRMVPIRRHLHRPSWWTAVWAAAVTAQPIRALPTNLKSQRTIWSSLVVGPIRSISTQFSDKCHKIKKALKIPPTFGHLSFCDNKKTYTNRMARRLKRAIKKSETKARIGDLNYKYLIMIIMLHIQKDNTHYTLKIYT